MTVGGWQGRAEPRGPSVSVVCPVSERHRGGKGTDREGEGGLGLLPPCFGSVQHERGRTRAHVDRTSVRERGARTTFPRQWWTWKDAEGRTEADRKCDAGAFRICVYTQKTSRLYHSPLYKPTRVGLGSLET